MRLSASVHLTLNLSRMSSVECDRSDFWTSSCLCAHPPSVCLLSICLFVCLQSTHVAFILVFFGTYI